MPICISPPFTSTFHANFALPMTSNFACGVPVPIPTLPHVVIAMPHARSLHAAKRRGPSKFHIIQNVQYRLQRIRPVVEGVLFIKIED